MDYFTKLIEAEMILMQGKELIMGTNYPGDDVLSVCEEAYKKLGEFIKEIKENPEDYKRKGDEYQLKDGMKRYQFETKIVRLNDEYPSMIMS